MRAIALVGLLLVCAAADAVADADVSITQYDTQDPVALGSSVSYAIVITNHGPSPATNVVLADNLPANVTFVAISAPDDWTCTAPPVDTAGTLNCSKASIDAQQAIAFTLTVKPTAVGIISNIANATTSVSDPNPENNSKTEETTVVAAPQPPNP